MAEQPLKYLPIGIGSWDDIRSRNLFCVDKTAKLDFLVSSRNKVFISRPRRMGKTLLCSILKKLFTNGDRDFEGTAIYGHWPEQQTYPVIHLSFIDIQGADFEQALKGALIAAFSAAGLTQAERLEHVHLPFNAFLKRFNQIAADQKLVFLLDEWDFPLSSHLDNEKVFNHNLKILHVFYSWLRTFEHTHFLLITGIMRYNDTSLFTGQDIEDISMRPDLADLLGYTQEELVTNYAPYIKRAAQALKITPDDLIDKITKHYDGFCFDYDAKVRLYCPDSINKFFDTLTSPYAIQMGQIPVFESYWMNSSNATAALRSYLQRDPLSAESLIDLCRRDITMAYEDLTTPSDFKRITKQQIMLQSGMLTIKEVVADNQNVPPSERMFVCRLTNYDVGAKYATVLTSYMLGVNERIARPYINHAQKALLSGDIEATCLQLNEMLCLVPYDVMASAQEKLYRSLFALWLRSPAITVQEEVPNNLGRIDLLLTTADHIYVVELKRLAKSSNTAKAKIKLLDTADQQILDNCYLNNIPTGGRIVTSMPIVISDKYRQIAAWRTTDKSTGTKQGLITMQTVRTK